jgi:tRNA(Ile)-lysidine synthase
LSAAGVRRLAAAKAVIRSWRALVPRSARTLVACSGGADSSALAAVLSAATRGIVLAHVVHDMRPRDEALADRDAVRVLAERLGVGFVEAEVRVPMGRGAGNAEASARRLRYAALERLAVENGCRFIATAHHADDQLESMLMAMIRGSGTAGLRGIAEKRVCGEVTLVRPMLGVTHAEAVGLCQTLGVAWREDATNADASRLRAALRMRVLPLLEELRPGASKRAARGAATVRAAHRMLGVSAETLLEDASPPTPWPKGHVGVWCRPVFREASPTVVGEAMRRMLSRAMGSDGADRLSARRLDAIVRAIQSPSGENKRFELPSGFRVEVAGDLVRLKINRDD